MPLAQRLVCPLRIPGLPGKPNSSQGSVHSNERSFFLNLLNNPPFLKDKKVAYGQGFFSHYPPMNIASFSIERPTLITSLLLMLVSGYISMKRTGVNPGMAGLELRYHVADEEVAIFNENGIQYDATI